MPSGTVRAPIPPSLRPYNGKGRVTLAVEYCGFRHRGARRPGAPSQSLVGLANMQQRAEQIGALFDVRKWQAGRKRVARRVAPAVTP